VRNPFGGPTVGDDLRAGVVLGVESIPDGLASGLLAGVNPAFGLYGYMVGTFSGAVSTASVFMSVQATGAMSVIIADVPQVHSGPTADKALFTLSIMTGVVMLAFGLLGLGSLVRFVPNSVLTGFINAVAVNIVLGQLGNFTAFSSSGSNRVTRAFDTAMHLTQWHWMTVAVGALTIVLILVLERTRVGALSLVVAVIVTSAATAVFGLESVKTLRDIADIPSSLPRPVLPSLTLAFVLVVPALSLALVGLVQGAAISNSVPNPDGRYPDASGDFRGQGVANIASGFLQGMPVGGSMSATAIVTSAGAKSRRANAVAGLTMAVLIVAVGPLVGYIAMPALAGLLILVGVRSFKAENILMVWRTGRVQAATMVTTFVLTLLIALQYAVLVGVGLSVILFVVAESNKIKVTRWLIEAPGALPMETDAPVTLPAHEVVVLQPYGSLFFAAAPVFESQLPEIRPQSSGSVVVIRLRGKQELGSTFITVVQRYAEALGAVGSRLMLVGVSKPVRGQLDATGTTDLIGAAGVFAATDRVTESLATAVAVANTWVDDHRS
jgi:sulfate permease, SulP family